VSATVAHQGLSSDAERIVMFTALATLTMCNSCNLVVAHFYAILNCLGKLDRYLTCSPKMEEF
jgi:hypothetical protein